MAIIKKDATITNTDDAFPGSFEVILSAQTKDRDGDTLLKEGWKQPLPEHITFDSDHGMTVEKTVGSGVPRIDEATGNLIVSGTYSSLPRAQEVRTLVNEGHIRTTSVAFMSEKTQKDGATVSVRELLNGAFVAIPSNREALVLSSKGFTRKAAYEPVPYDPANESGPHVTCPNCGKFDDTDAKYCDQCGFKLEGADGVTVSKGLKAGARNSAADAGKVQDIHDAAAGLGADCGMKSFSRKDADTEDDTDPGVAAQAVDAAIDEAINLFAAVDLTSLPAEVQQAIALVQAADAAVDELLDALGVSDPDEDADSGAVQAPAAGAQVAPAAGVRSAPVAGADSDAVSVKNLEELALQIQAAQFI